MSRIAIVCPSATGHLNPSLTLAAALANRGHELIFYTVPDALERIQGAGFAYRVYGEKEFPLGAAARYYEKLGELKGMEAVRFTIELVKKRTVPGLRELPALVREDRIEGLVVDQLMVAAAVVARSEGVPYVTVSNALALNQHPAIPPVFTTWPFGKGLMSRLRNRIAYTVFNRLTRPVLDVINGFQQQRRLPRYRHIDATNSTLAQVCQQPAAFDFPREPLTPTFHYTGPYHSAATRPPVEFPYERLSGQPLVYASMGTLQNRIRHVFRVIAEACEPLPVQLVISLGGADPDEFRDLPGDPITVCYAPQLDLLQRASLCITHAGLNTALESLSHGVPMLAVPVTNDQPGVAARIDWLRVGRCLPLKQLKVPTAGQAIRELLEDGLYCDNARAFQQEIEPLDGPSRAAEIVETAIATGRPVLREAA